jgi:DNA invertase Pin-like site-specific DNA recombinase
MATKRQASKRAIATRTRGTRTLDAVLRVSRVNGREGDTFHSPEVQREAITAWAKVNHVRIAKWHRELDVSGGSTARNGLQSAITRATNGTTDGVAVAAIDRFARNFVEGMAEVQRLRDAGAAFVAVAESIDTAAPSEATRAHSEFLLGLLFLLAKWVRDQLTEKWEGIRHRHIEVNGVGTQTPYGYRKVPKGTEGAGTLIIEPAEAEFVREMFARRAHGESWPHIARAITEAGARTRNGNHWTPQRVSDAVHRRVYLGEVSSGHDIVNPAAHKALVTHDVFDAANRRTGRGIERRGANDRGLLTGILRCATCGGGMKRIDPSAAARAQGTRSRYACRANYGWGKCPRPMSVVADDIEAAMVSTLHADALSKIAVEGTDATDALDLARDALDRAQHTLTTWAIDPTLDIMREQTPDIYAEGTRVRTEAVVAAREVVERERATAGVRADLPADLGAVWDSLDLIERRSWLSSWFAVVAVFAPGRRGDDVRGRIEVFTVNDADTPEGFVVRDVGADGRGRRVARFRPIDRRVR